MPDPIPRTRQGQPAPTYTTEPRALPLTDAELRALLAAVDHCSRDPDFVETMKSLRVVRSFEGAQDAVRGMLDARRLRPLPSRN